MFTPLTIVSLLVCLMLIYIIYTKLKESSGYKLLYDMLLNVEKKCENYDTEVQIEISNLKTRQIKIKEDLSNLSINLFKKLELLEEEQDNEANTRTINKLEEQARLTETRLFDSANRIETAEKKIDNNERLYYLKDESIKDLSKQLTTEAQTRTEELLHLQNEIVEISSSKYLKDTFNENTTTLIKKEIKEDFNVLLNEELNNYFKDKEERIIEMINQQQEAMKEYESNLSILKNKLLFLSIDVNKLSIEPTKNNLTKTITNNTES